MFQQHPQPDPDEPGGYRRVLRGRSRPHRKPDPVTHPDGINLTSPQSRRASIYKKKKKSPPHAFRWSLHCVKNTQTKTVLQKPES